MKTTNTLSQAQHTAGPWSVTGHDGRNPMVQDTDGGSICAVWDTGCKATQEANARLIAAAPDLLAALEAAQAALRTAACHSENVLPDLATYCHAEATKAYDIFSRAKQS